MPRGLTPSKGRRNLPPKHAAPSSPTAKGNLINSIFRISSVLLLLSLSNVLLQLSLSPVYGAIPASQHKKLLRNVLFVLVWPMWYFFERFLPKRPFLYLPLLAFWIPSIQYFLFQYSSLMGATLGPSLTEGPILLLLFLFSTAAVSFEFRDYGFGNDNKLVAGALSQTACFLSSSLMEQPLENTLSRYIGWNQLFTRSGLQMLTAIIYSILVPSKLLLFAVPSALHMLLYNVHVPLGLTDAVLQESLAQHDFVLLARHESNTGYLSVLESNKEHFRVLRCDHSLLGGEWQQPPNGLEYTSRVKEPVYAVFVMLEAVRLVELHKTDKVDELPDAEKNALVIGLGIGTTPSALVAHGINTTTVEIDPIVHEYAKRYFDLPLNHTTIVQDALTFVDESNAKGSRQYDYIIHDVFTGGAEPVELFSYDFLLGLHSLLKPNGVIAINYAGDLLLPPAQIILRTIKSVFPTCRMFRENEGPALGDADFTNLVIICTKLHTPFFLREPVEGDFLGSYARKHYLKPKYELPSNFFKGKSVAGIDYSLLRKDDTRRLEKWQAKGAVGHWALMRIVLPDQVWEAW